jgi:hypothetical protein
MENKIIETNDEPTGAPMMPNKQKTGAIPNKQKTSARPNKQKTGAMPTKKKGVDARFPFLGLVTVVTARYFFEPIRWRNAKRMRLGGMQIIVLLARVDTIVGKSLA